MVLVRGFRPYFPAAAVFLGQPLAYILYEMLTRECTHAVQAQLDAEGLSLHLPTDERNSVQSIVTDADAATTAQLLDVTSADVGTIIAIVPASD
eukprot:2540133-Pyramimonas_sp.AAC.1